MKRALLLLCGTVLLYSISICADFKELKYIDKNAYGSIAVADANHDGLNEMYFLYGHEFSPWPWSIWKNLGNNNYQYETMGYPDSSSPWVAGYLDDDTLLDIVGIKFYPTYSMGVWEAPSYGSYVTNLVWSSIINDSIEPWDTYITDLDQDGKKEILCRARADWTTRIYECTGDNQYQLVYKGKPGNYISYHGGMCYGDFDKDGLMEIVSGTGDGSWPEEVSRVFIYENTAIGADSYALVHTDSVLTKNAYELCSGGDMDGDGWSEFVVGGKHNDGTDLWDDVVTIFEATGNNTYVAIWCVILQTYLYATNNTIPNLGSEWDVKIGDIDGDDTAEVIVATSESLIVYKAFGNDNYHRLYQGLTGPGPYSNRLNSAVLLVNDINKNGYDEIVVSGYYFVKPSGSTQYYETRIYEIMGEATFDSLRATAKDSCIQVNWSTSRQFANYGFNVWRATAAAGPYGIIYETNDTIRLDTLLLSYSFDDSAVISGAKYFYKVQAKALNDTSIFFGPDSATGVAGRPELPITNYEYQLFQNAPNPLRSQTHISYQLAKPGNVSLKIYNTLGQLVNTLVDGQQQPGTYSASWNGKDENGYNVSSGIYIYKLNCEDWSGTKKMIILK